MSKILGRLNNRFQTILEDEIDISWKDPNSSNYDRQVAEDALFHTIGPLTENPSWTSNWSSKGEPVPGFHPGGPAPRWSEEEIVSAFAGDPNMLFTASGNPRSPMYGSMGGAPLFRLARKVARYYAKATDRQFIADLYSNGFIPLMKMMQPGYDRSESPFISYAMRGVQSAMEHGIGGSKQSDLASGFESTKGETAGVVGFKGLLERSDPKEVREIAQQVRGKYQEQASHDKHSDNPLGKYSSSFFMLANQYAEALEIGDEDRIDAARSQIRQRVTDVEDENIFIPGASTGMGQAISTADRKTSIGIASMDAPTGGGDNVAGMAGNMVGDDDREQSMFDPETITRILDIAINYDLNDIIGNIPRYAELAATAKDKFTSSGEKGWGAKAGKIGGKMGANELRYVIRTMGPIGSNYPGKGTVRANPETPRDSFGWWEPGSDPEIEPIPKAPPGTLWKSNWTRGGYKGMGPLDISQEMTKETMEFNKLGIPTKRKLSTKIDSRTGRETQAVITKVAVANTLRSATIKLKFIAMLERDQLGTGKIGESVENRHPLMEEIAKTDNFDRELIAEACDWACNRIQRVLKEKAPPGWKKTVEHMKDDEGMDDDKAFSLAWATHNKGGSRPDTKKKNKSYTESMQPVDSLLFEEPDMPTGGLPPERPIRQGTEPVAYRGYIINHDQTPIPIRNHDWQFAHEEYDGPEDRRIGSAGSLEDAKREIDEMLLDAEEGMTPYDSVDYISDDDFGEGDTVMPHHHNPNDPHFPTPTLPDLQINNPEVGRTHATEADIEAELHRQHEYHEKDDSDNLL